MLRFWTVGLALVLAPLAAAQGKELKPKFGNIDGIYYSDVSGNREACLSALRRKIYLCRENTNFESNTKNRKYAGCLPIFRQQAQGCVEHFTRMQSRCHGSGRVSVPDFTGFSCTATATVVEEGGAPERGAGPGIAPMDGRMKARTLVNLRAGPGTNHPVVGALSSGQEVQVTGRAGDWLRIAVSGGTAFVHGQFMVGVAGQGQRGQSAGRKAPESGRANPALAAAWNRCKATESRYGSVQKAWRKCLSTYGSRASTKCSDVREEGRAATGEIGNACCGSYRPSSPREEQMVSYLKKGCSVHAFYRCRQGGGSRSSCERHLP